MGLIIISSKLGDPISPMLFNLVGDVLTRMLNKATDNNLIGGLLTILEAKGLFHYNMQMTHSSFLILVSVI